MLGRGGVKVCERHDDFWNCYFCKKTLPFDAITCSRCGAYSMGDQDGRERWHSGTTGHRGALTRIVGACLVLAVLVVGTLAIVGALDTRNAQSARCMKTGDCSPLIRNLVGSDSQRSVEAVDQNGVASVPALGIGTCLDYGDDEQVAVVECGDDHDAAVTTVVQPPLECPVGTDAIVARPMDASRYCVEDNG